jgi:uncharacterized lipoprotein YddW (UPF0748 family)
MQNFQKILNISLIILLVTATTIGITLEAQTKSPIPKKGIWITKYDIFDLDTPLKLENAIKRLVSLGFTDVFVDVDPGCTIYPSTYNYKGNVIDSTCKDLRIKNRNYMQEILKFQSKINVCGWMQYGYMVNDQNPMYLAAPEIRMKTSYGSETDFKGHRWINPLHPETVGYTNKKLKDLFSYYNDLKCVQYDDHFGFSYEMGYDTYTRNKYKTSTGLNVPSDPRNFKFTKWRNDQLTFNNNSIIKNARSLRTGLKVSISPNPLDFSYFDYMQDITKWVDNKMADELIFQVYRNNSLQFAADISEPDMKALRKKVPTSMAIAFQANGKVLSNDTLKAMANYTKNAGYAGRSYFYYRNSTLDTNLKPSTMRDAILKL